MTPTDWIVALVAVLALCLSVASLIYSRRATKAAEQSAAASARAAAVAERQEQRQVEEAEQDAVDWRLEILASAGTGPLQGESIAAVRLSNIGRTTAHEVHVRLPRGTQVIGPAEPHGEVSIDAGASVLVQAVAIGPMPEPEVVVQWRVRPDGRAHSRRYPWSVGA